MKHGRRVVAAGLLLATVLIGGGCVGFDPVRVQPWERGTLADELMNPARDPIDAAMDEHIYFSRESAAGGQAVGGSGCGCN